MEGLRDRMGIWRIEGFLFRGAEADLYTTTFLGERAVLKARVPKSYRHLLLDQRIRRMRTSREAYLLHKARRVGVRTPIVWYVDPDKCLIVMEYLEGRPLRDLLLEGSINWRWVAGEMGRDIASLHNGDIVHGDLTTSNVMVDNTALIYFDFGLGEATKDIEGKAGDLELLSRVIHSTHPEIEEGFMEIFLEVYGRRCREGPNIIKRFKRIRRMGRYIPRDRRNL